MIVVLFYRRGLMGSSEFSWEGIFRWLRRKKGGVETTKGEMMIILDPPPARPAR